MADADALELLKSDLGSYVASLTGLSLPDNADGGRRKFSAADIKLDPMSVMSNLFSNKLENNILSKKTSHLYPAVVCLSFVDAGGLRSCKAAVPVLHDSIGNPFRDMQESERADMISHFPTFTFNEGLTQTPLVPGSIVLVSFDNPYNRWTSGVIEKVPMPRPTALPEYAMAIDSAKELWGNPDSWQLLAGAGLSTIGAGGLLSPLDPGNCAWSNGAKAYVTEWDSTAYSQWNGTLLRNGLLEETGMLEKDPVSGAQLLPPAMEDFKKLAIAYAKKFPGKTLKGSGYRPYASQVNVRVKRITPKSPCGDGSQHNAAGQFIGFAATPGRSNHGWGAAVDIDRPASGWTKGQEGDSPEFRWINKFGKDFNFVFGVRNEHWHIDWMPFSSQTTGGVAKTAQKSWTSDGQNDASITLS